MAVSGTALEVARAAQLAGRVYDRTRNIVTDRFRERRFGPRFRAVQQGDDLAVAIYFAGEAHSLYQLRQWLWPLERLSDSLAADGGSARPVGVFCRNISNAVHVATNTFLPVRFGRLSQDLDAFFQANPLRIVFYVNQNLLNFQSIRYPRPAHVHLSHGESEKVSMTSNQLKAYDEVFVAGAAARDRIQRALVNMPAERLRRVGRPQLDETVAPPPDWKRDSQRRTVLYAPTWEGDSPLMSYGSVARAGVQIVQSFMERGWQVIYRPHPHTGINDRATRAAHERIVQLLDGDNDRRDGQDTEAAPRHYIDLGSPYGWHHIEADACVCDMSAIAFDWLSSGKPFVMMAPNREASLDAQGIVGKVPQVRQEEAARVADILAHELYTGAKDASRDLATYYFGDITPGAQIGRFITESRRLIEERTRQLHEQGRKRV